MDAAEETRAWKAAERVVCDLCNRDYSNSGEVGGLLFGSKACCPRCGPEIERLAREHDEEHFIGARCPDNKSFAQWVREDLR